jgi:hypothetical protein
MTQKRGRTRKRPARVPVRPSLVHQFLIVLSNTEPLVWRRIQVPEDYSFWDLHVAIQDAMGWLDYHLHEFTVADVEKGRVIRLGIPDEDFPDERPCIPDWEVLVSDYFRDGSPALYRYDFGDGWHHAVIDEGIADAEPALGYPRCLGGANARPPEDCGGTTGFEQFKRAISDPDHPEHEEYLVWVGGHYDPEAFDPSAVRFDDPRERWKLAFQR